MKPKNPQFLPRSDLETQEMKQIQRDISKKAIFKDKNNFDSEKIQDLTVVGIDQGFIDDKAVSTAIVMENGKTIEEVSAAEEINFPYIPGLLAFREGGSIVRALKKLDAEPDLLMLDGSGRIHYRQAGIATHIGVTFNTPAVGVSKKLLCGEVDLPEKMETGKMVKVYSDSSLENIGGGETIGYAFQSKQYNTGNKTINPLYISSGHKIRSATAVKLVSNYCGEYKLPEPIRIADKKVAKMKERYR